MAQILFNCTEEEQAAFFALARQCQTSVGALGQLAMRQLLSAAKAGAQPMVASSLLKNAIQVETCESFCPAQHFPD